MKPRSSNGRRDDRGAVAIIVVIFLIVFMVLLAFVVDLGRVYAKKAQLQNAADAAALAAGSLLDCQTVGPAAARTAAQTYATENGVPTSGQTILFPANDQVTVVATETVPMVFAQFAQVGPRVVVADSTVTRECSTRYQFVADVNFDFNGGGATVGGGIFAGRCFEGGGGIFGTVAVSTSETYNCSPFHNGAGPIDNGSKSPVCSNASSVATCRYNQTGVSAAAAVAAVPWNIATFDTALAATANSCSTYKKSSDFPASGPLYCTGDLSIPASYQIKYSIAATGSIDTNNTSSFATTPAILVYAKTGSVTLKMDSVPANVSVYAPTYQGKDNTNKDKPSIQYSGSGAGLFGGLFGYNVNLSGGNATSSNGVLLGGLGPWRLTE